MAWIESHTTLREHPKRKRLSRLLGIKARETIGLLHILWWWVLDFAPEGDLSAYSDEDIADSIDWEGDAGQLVAALTQAGFMDADRQVHDWDEFAEKWIARRRANAERMRLARAGRNGTVHSKGSTHVQSTLDARAPQNVESVGLPDQPDQPTYEHQPDQPVNPTQTLPLRGKGSAGAGPISRDVVDRLSSLPPDLGAASFQAAAEVALSEIGFACEREVAVDERGDGHAGRVDLVAERGEERLAIEFDRASPRAKSIKKLSQVSDALRVVVLREPFSRPLPPGLDAVIGGGSRPGRPSPPAARPSRSPPRNGRANVPTDPTAYTSGEYGRLASQQMAAKLAKSEG